MSKVRRTVSILLLQRRFELGRRFFEKRHFRQAEAWLFKSLKLNLKQIEHCYRVGRYDKLRQYKQLAGRQTVYCLASIFLQNSTRHLDLSALRAALRKEFLQSRLGLKKVFGDQHRHLLQEAELLVCTNENFEAGPRRLNFKYYSLVDADRLKRYEEIHLKRRIRYLESPTLAETRPSEARQLSLCYERLSRLHKDGDQRRYRRLVQIFLIYQVYYEPYVSLKLLKRQIRGLRSKLGRLLPGRGRQLRDDLVLLKANLYLAYGQNSRDFLRGLDLIDKALKDLKDLKHYSSREYVFLTTWSAFVKQLVKKSKNSRLGEAQRLKLEPPAKLLKFEQQQKREIAQIKRLAADIRLFVKSVNRKLVIRTGNEELNRVLGYLHQSRLLSNRAEALKALVRFLKGYYPKLAFSRVKLSES